MSQFKFAAHGLLAAVVVLTGANAFAMRTWTSGVRDQVSGMNFSYFLPDGYDASIDYPLVIYMHGAGLRGRDNRHTQAREMIDLIARTDTDFPAILLAPQLPGGSWRPSNSVDQTDRVIESVLNDLSVDESRVYLTGLSAGGFGVVEYLADYNARGFGPVTFAAGAPAAGARIGIDAVEALRETPIWLAHSATDNRVSPSTSRAVYQALAGVDEIDFTGVAAGGALAESGLVRYTEYANAPHNISDRFFGSTDYYEWLFAQELATTVVPEPSSILLMAFGLIAAAPRRRRQGAPRS